MIYLIKVRYIESGYELCLYKRSNFILSEKYSEHGGFDIVGIVKWI